MKKAILFICLLSTIVYSQETFNYVSEHIVQKSNYDNSVVSESYNQIYVTFAMYSDKTGYLNFSSGAFFTLYQFNGGDYGSNWYWNAVDKNNSRCNIQINTTWEESQGIMYLSVQYRDYTFYYKLRLI